MRNKFFCIVALWNPLFKSKEWGGMGVNCLTVIGIEIFNIILLSFKADKFDGQNSWFLISRYENLRLSLFSHKYFVKITCSNIDYSSWKETLFIRNSPKHKFYHSSPLLITLYDMTEVYHIKLLWISFLLSYGNTVLIATYGWNEDDWTLLTLFEFQLFALGKLKILCNVKLH